MLRAVRAFVKLLVSLGFLVGMVSGTMTCIATQRQDLVDGWAEKSRAFALTMEFFSSSGPSWMFVGSVLGLLLLYFEPMWSRLLWSHGKGGATDSISSRPARGVGEKWKAREAWRTMIDELIDDVPKTLHRQKAITWVQQVKRRMGNHLRSASYQDRVRPIQEYSQGLESDADVGDCLKAIVDYLKAIRANVPASELR